ncbi:MAG: hypothetical protein IK082_02645 [Oscillospiraceae bacterium]|nr:hypothetical protein [Oscillospiraceae bacterium]
MGAYDWCFYELPREPVKSDGMLPEEQQYFWGDSCIPGATINLPYRAYLKTGFIDAEPHFHRDEEYLAFVGHDVRDAFESFDAEIWLWMGENIDDMEKIVITAPTMVRVPKFWWHGPIEIRRLGKPLFFQPILYSAKYYAIRQRRGTEGPIYYNMALKDVSPYGMDYGEPYQLKKWTEGTGRYSHLVYTFEKQANHWGDFMPPYQAYFRGHDCMPDSDIYTCFRPYLKEAFIDKYPNFHPEEEYLCFTGHDMLDPWGSFDAEMEFWIGPEPNRLEKHIISAPTMVRIPPFTWHCPLQYLRVGKPVYLQVLGTHGKFGFGQLRFHKDGTYEIEYAGSGGHRPCVLEEGKQCTFCGKCVTTRDTSHDPQSATEAAEYYNSLVLEPTGRWYKK